ncbi:MAG: DUF1800 domain-containing protein, partial [Gloeobacteraceae cyanobacterium ES-bin-144]|nr:DUF1800 domain-containing protein [Verrucomicrobiales bacterium]
MLPKAENSWTLFEAAHLLNRAGFGGSPEEIKKFHSKGRVDAVNAILTATDAPDAFPLPTWANEQQALADMRNRIKQRRETMAATKDLTPEQAENARREMFKDIQKENRQRALESQGWWFRRMLNSQAPLREKMTLFWHDHFATSIQKVKQPVLMIKQNELFRNNALGSFSELTHSILIDPAMLLYLDTESSRKGHPNENFAREIMELFTLGEGNYAEEDIREAARAFTGYQLSRFTGKITHNQKQWDESNKTIFGKTGNFNGDDVINLIFEKTQTARFMSKKIWEFFVYENPSPLLIDRLADVLRKSNYQLEPLLREIFLSSEFYSEPSIRSQIKSPIQLIIALLKQLEIKDPPVGFPITAQQQLGQILFMPPNVAGWDWGQAWINTNTLFTRYNLAGFLVKGSKEGGKSMEGIKEKIKGIAALPKIPGLGWKGPNFEEIAPRSLREKPNDLVDSLVFRFFQGVLPQKARDSFIEYATAQKGVVFTDKETAEL